MTHIPNVLRIWFVVVLIPLNSHSTPKSRSEVGRGRGILGGYVTDTLNFFPYIGRQWNILVKKFVGDYAKSDVEHDNPLDMFNGLDRLSMCNTNECCEVGRVRGILGGYVTDTLNFSLYIGR